MDATENLILDLPDVDKRILEWREDGFRKLGFTPKVAAALAQTQVDLWEAKGLLDKGCSHAILLKILVGRMRNGEEDIHFSLKWLLSEIADHDRLAKELADIKE